jgi:hypothetical protein
MKSESQGIQIIFFTAYLVLLAEQLENLKKKKDVLSSKLHF